MGPTKSCFIKGRCGAVHVNNKRMNQQNCKNACSPYKYARCTWGNTVIRAGEACPRKKKKRKRRSKYMKKSISYASQARKRGDKIKQARTHFVPFILVRHVITSTVFHTS